MSATIKFNHQGNREFNIKLRQRVQQYFKQTGTNKGTGFMYFKIIFYIIGLSTSYATLFMGANVWLMLLSWVLVGFFSAFSALNICHDAIHGSISKNQTVN
ncbi:MAG: acyl-CoA desaturase, partial [Bacteroidia bacterium]